MVLSLAHLKNPAYANENPWDIEAREKASAAAAAAAAAAASRAAMGNLDGWTIGSGGGTGIESADDARKNHFKKQARQAHPGGKINSNKIEATYKFLKRKQEKGAILSKEEMDIMERMMGTSTGTEGEAAATALEALKKKAEEERKEREKASSRKGSFGGE